MIPKYALERLVAIASLTAGAIHAIVFQSHLDDWWAHGIFFMAAALAQVVFGVALLSDAVQPRYFGETGYRAAMRLLYMGGIAGNLFIIGLYVVSRTIGVPFGPGAGVPEPVGAIDIVSKLAEAIVIVGLAALLLHGEKAAPR
jgi:hypothetical protein